jgi:hypothetical protein
MDFIYMPHDACTSRVAQKWTHDGRDGADNVLWDNVSMLYGLGIEVRVPE